MKMAEASMPANTRFHQTIRQLVSKQVYDLWFKSVKVADDVEELSPATDEELALLRMFDPQRFFLGKPAETVQVPAPAK